MIENDVANEKVSEGLSSRLLSQCQQVGGRSPRTKNMPDGHAPSAMISRQVISVHCFEQLYLSEKPFGISPSGIHKEFNCTFFTCVALMSLCDPSEYRQVRRRDSRLVPTFFVALLISAFAYSNAFR